MADLTATLLTPTSIRLSWDAVAGATFEIWWRSDHPPGQEFTRLAFVTGTSYDVTGLNWTTIYEFKIRYAIGETGFAFGNVLTIFCQCGQGFRLSTPSDVWQQDVDVHSGVVGMSTLSTTFEEISLYRVQNDSAWTFLKTFDTPTNYPELPAYTRIWGTRLFLVAKSDYDPTWFWVYENGVLYNTDIGNFRDLLYGLGLNANGRVAVGVMDLVSVYDRGLQIFISDDWGRNFDSPVVLAASGYSSGGFIQEGYAGDLLFMLNNRNPGYSVGNVKIYSYAEGGSLVLLHATATGDLIAPGDSRYSSFSAVYPRIVGFYQRYYGSAYHPTILISTNYGSSFTEKTMAGVYGGNAFMGPICVVGTSLVYVGYSSATGKWTIFRSTDDGDSWAEVFDLTPYYAPYPQYSSLKSDGDDIVFTSCDFSTVVDGQLAYLISHDQGATWKYVSMDVNFVEPI